MIEGRASNGTVQIAVSDEGPGIPADERQRVLRKYARGQTGRDNDDGQGLGLYVARRIAEGHGGRLWVDGASSKGARVVIEVARAT